MSNTATVERAYQDSSLLYRGLRAFGWGPLLNLGYFPLWELPLLVFGLQPFQRRLARRSIGLLETQPRELVIDVGCGQGFTTHEIAERATRAVGVDLLEGHVRAARLHYGAPPGLGFVTGDARRLGEVLERLEIPAGSVDKIHALECTFHFGHEGRRAFLHEAARALRPGGRLVLVDLMWRDEDPERIEELDPERRVRDTWRFDYFEPLERYRKMAAEAGLEQERCIDWTAPVLDRFQLIGNVILGLSRYSLGRLALGIARPATFQFSPEQWEQNRLTVAAMDNVRRFSCYFALVLKKPAP